MVERLLFFHAGKFRVKACSFYDITRKGRKGVRRIPYGTINCNFEKIWCIILLDIGYINTIVYILRPLSASKNKLCLPNSQKSIFCI